MSSPPKSNLRFAFRDEWSEVFADDQGYLWRPPEFEPRYAVLHAADRLQSGGWQKFDDWFRSRRVVKEYAPSSAEKLWNEHVDPGAAARDTASSVGLYVIAGLALYFGAKVLPPLLARRGA